MIDLFVIPLFSFLNRLRGGGFWADKLISRSLYWITPIILLAGYFLIGLIPAIIFTIVYFSWALLPWGRWQTMGRDIPTGREVSLFEKVVEFIPSIVFKNELLKDFFSLNIRNLIALSPLLIVWFFTGASIYVALMFLVAFIHPVIYLLSWYVWDKFQIYNPVGIGELLMGALWGTLLILIKSI